MLSQKTKYALKALLLLAEDYKKRRQDSVLISEIAERGRIPKKFLENILLELKNRGMLRSKKGKKGGYRLEKAPEEISLGRVIRIFDGPLALLPCVSQSAHRKCDECEDEATCGIRMAMAEVRDATVGILDRTNLRDVLRNMENAKAKSGTMYYI